VYEAVRANKEFHVADTTYGNRSESFAADAAEAVESDRESAARGIHSAAEKIRSAAEQLPGGEKVRHFAGQAAQTFDRTASYLRETEPRAMLDDLVNQTKARPMAFLIGAVAVGFVAGRMLRR
jgi:hypothetical protein